MKRVLAILVLILLLTGCGETNEEENNTVNNNAINNIINGSNEGEDNTVDIELYSTDRKLVFKRKENYYYVFYYDGNKIINYEEYKNYEDETTALVAAELINEKKEELGNVKGAYRLGTYVVIEYTEEEYSGYTTDGVRNIYSNLEQVFKNE